MEEQGERRNFFANENLLYQMYCNLKTHPYYQFFFGLESRDNDEGFIHFDFNNEGEAYRLRILGNEALEGITIQKKDKEAGCIIEVTSSEDFLQEGLSRKVNARAKINSVYGDKRRRRNGSE